jgi:Secretion system C-terminal sorting domain
MRIRTIMMLLCALMIAAAQLSAQSIVLDSVGSAGLRAGSTDSIKTGVQVRFHIRFNNSTAENIVGLSNGFRIYSTDGATWGSTTMIDSASFVAIVPELSGFGGPFLVVTSGDGALSDTATLAGIAQAGGYPAGANRSCIYINIGPIPTGATFHQKHICIDSASFPPGGDWLWSGDTDMSPAWAGPYCYTIWDEGTGVDDDGIALPKSFSLSQNYPNPFNPTTNIKYALAEKSHVELSIYNVLGQKISTLVNAEQTAGEYSAPWDASQVASGVYFYRLETEKFTSTKKMMLVK